jgi:hypothetical protein
MTATAQPIRRTRAYLTGALGLSPAVIERMEQAGDVEIIDEKNGGRNGSNNQKN